MIFVLTIKMHVVSCPNSSLLAKAIADKLKCEFIALDLQKFSNNEILVYSNQRLNQLNECLLVHTCSSNASLLELMFSLDLLNRHTSAKVDLLLPYLCYSRQNRVIAPNASLGLKVIANMISSFGNIKKVILVDLHCESSIGFFSVPIKHISLDKLLARFLKTPVDIVISPDAGGAKRAKSVANLLNVPFVVLNKTREENGIKMLLTEDVKNQNCIVIDDLVDSGNTLYEASKTLKENGAKNIEAFCSHVINLEAISEKLEFISCFYFVNALNNEKQNTKTKSVLTKTIQINPVEYLCEMI